MKLFLAYVGLIALSFAWVVLWGWIIAKAESWL